MSEAGGPGKAGDAVEAVLLVVGVAAIVGGIAAFSWAAAVIAVGVLLTLTAIDLRR